MARMLEYFRNLKTAIVGAPPFHFCYSSVAVSKEELKIVSFWSAILAMILLLPYVYAYFLTPSDLHFTGSFGYTAQNSVGEDHEMHLAWIYQAAHGALLGKNLYTSIPHEGAVINLYLSAVGLLAKITGLSLRLCNDIGRFFIAWALGISIYYFVAFFFTRRERFWGWLIAIFASGFGWILPYLRQLFHLQISSTELAWKSVDMGFGQICTFTAMFLVPLYSVAFILLVLTLRWAYIALISNNYRMAFIAGISLFTMSFVHPYDVIISVTILLSAASLLTICYPKQWKQWILISLLICLCGAPSVLYNYWILKTNPGLCMWAGQNRCISCSLFGFCFGLGVPFLLSLLWLLRIYKIKQSLKIILAAIILLTILFISILYNLAIISSANHRLLLYTISGSLFLLWHLHHFRKNKISFRRFLLMTTWIFMFPILVYSPITYQIKFGLGLSLPFAIISTDYIRFSATKMNLSIKTRNFIYLIFIMILSLSHLALYVRVWAITTHPKYYKDFFIDKEFIVSLSIIEKGANNGSVLGVDSINRFVPAYTGKQVVGSSQQSENNGQKAAEQFYSGALSSAEKLT